MRVAKLFILIERTKYAKKMKNEPGKRSQDRSTDLQQYIRVASNLADTRDSKVQTKAPAIETSVPEILFICSFPPRVCGIATYSQDLIRSMKEKFGNSFSIQVCALESGQSRFNYPPEVKFRLNTSNAWEYSRLARLINENPKIKMVVIQHEFGFFHNQVEAFQQFMYELSKPVVIEFHTVLPNPGEKLKKEVISMASIAKSIIVMTNHAAGILKKDYGISEQKISVIAHGTHLVPYLDRNSLKEKYGFAGRKVLTTFGLLSSGKNIETTLNALPGIVKLNPDTLFLILGKTHPEVVKNEGEKYRESLESLVKSNNLSEHVKFINQYLSLPDLLEYLQLTDIYIFSTNDPNQAVSGTFAYAMSCGCAIISTPIPHAREVLSDNSGIIIDFGNSKQLESAVIRLLNDEELRTKISINSLQKITSTTWENSAIGHALVLEKIPSVKIALNYNLPPLNLKHLQNMTTDVGVVQFAKINHPDMESGYTLDDNARALIAACMHYELTGVFTDLALARKYLNFIKYCQQPGGNFLNYVDKNKVFTDQNQTNLDDANGRAIWALGYVISKKTELPTKLITLAMNILNKALSHVQNITSSRSMAFIIKGLYYAYSQNKSQPYKSTIIKLANRLVEMYKHESSENWLWFESYLTYANSALPEALLYAWQLTGDVQYKNIARQSFDFLLTKTFSDKEIKVISNKSWLERGGEQSGYGEQPIDVAYSILALDSFYDSFYDNEYLRKMNIAFSWFSGNNRLHHIVYNPCTGGCYDGLEETHVNINQGAESTVSFLIARMTIAKYKNDS
jgi:glycosyltransferase involved in cell wall biosynthesis